MRWLGASVLTGITGGALIGASIYIALEGTTIFAQAPERAVATVSAPRQDDKATLTARKGDKLNRSEIVASAKQAFRAPMTIRTGDREVIKVRQFVRVATNLSLTAGTYARTSRPSIRCACSRRRTATAMSSRSSPKSPTRMSRWSSAT